MTLSVANKRSTFKCREEHERLQSERAKLRAKLLAKPMLHGIALTPEEVERANKIGNQILAEPHLWDDLVPLDPSCRAQAVGASSPPAQRPGRNDPYWCASGRKYKHCHLRTDAEG